VARLEPELTAAYAGIAGPDARAVGVAYDAPWRTIGLAAALAAARAEELRRGVCLVGPHRDELILTISSMPARTHASQGEQRSMALALRLAGHRVVGESAGESPVLLLDDVFSELDDTRSQALLDHLPPGQAILTTTGAIPPGATPALVVQATTAHLTPHPHPASISDVVANGAPPAPDAPKTSPPTPNPTDIGAPMSPTDQFAPKTAAPTPARTDSGAPVSPADHFAPKSVTGPVSRERPA
jgi:hypothetical protein